MNFATAVAQPNFSATPQNPDLLRWVGIQVAVVVLAWLIGMILRRFWPRE